MIEAADAFSVSLFTMTATDEECAKKNPRNGPRLPPFSMQRLGVVMEPASGNENEVERDGP